MSPFRRSNVARSDPPFSASPCAIVVRVLGPETTEDDAKRSFAELEQLLLGLGVETAARVVQRRESSASPTYLGGGKLRELAAITGGPGPVLRGPARGEARVHDAHLLVVADDELSPGQQRNLERALACEVLDRTAVILRVFEARARTPQARLEIELARLEYELPRIRDDHSLGDREGGGGRASRGHTNVELAKQRARARIAAVRHELQALALTEQQGRGRRSDVLKVALVGYTNAGKSSLMRRLTGADVLVEDKPFATLGTTVRQMLPPARPPVVVTDTVGFLERLPHGLIASFRSTLAEALESWLLLHVADASDPSFRRHIRVTEHALEDVGASAVPTRLVLNKADRLEERAREALRVEFPNALVMSALEEADGARLRKSIEAFFAQHLTEATLVVPYAKAAILAELRDKVQVLDETYADSIEVTLRATDAVISTLKARVRGR